MAYLIGTDEAGYGPNLGPLVISASLWQVPDGKEAIDLYAELAEVVSARANLRASPAKIAIGDSKSLYKPKGRLTALEQGVLACLAATEQPANSWRDLFAQLAADCLPSLDQIPWYTEYDCAVPIDAESTLCHQLAGQLRTEMQSRGVVLQRLRSTVLFPGAFNDQVQQLGSKGEVLSRATLQLVQTLIQPLDAESVLIQCDKHGGRNRYAPVLQTAFPEPWIEVCEESRACSTYRWGPPSERVTIKFQAKGERFLPSALASMVSKYLRELAMLAFNRYWSDRLPDLRPTAGYPVDAKRFRAEITECRKDTGISEHILWRNR